MYLFFDTETTGVPPGNAKVHMCQLAWILQSDTAKNLAHGNFLIQPDGWTIPDELVAIHGISTAIANTEGYPVGEVLSVFSAMCYFPVRLVAHNIQFDTAIVAAEFSLGSVGRMPFMARKLSVPCEPQRRCVAFGARMVASSGRSSWSYINTSSTAASRAPTMRSTT